MAALYRQTVSGAGQRQYGAFTGTAGAIALAGGNCVQVNNCTGGPAISISATALNGANCLQVNRCTDGVECTDEEHRYNRRTEFKILAGPTTLEIEEKVDPDATDKANDKPADKSKGQKPGGKQSLRPVFFYQN